MNFPIGCVQVELLRDEAGVVTNILVWDSKCRHIGANPNYLTFSPYEWRRFLAAVKSGSWDIEFKNIQPEKALPGK